MQVNEAIGQINTILRQVDLETTKKIGHLQQIHNRMKSHFEAKIKKMHAAHQSRLKLWSQQNAELTTENIKLKEQVEALTAQVAELQQRNDSLRSRRDLVTSRTTLVLGENGWKNL